VNNERDSMVSKYVKWNDISSNRKHWKNCAMRWKIEYMKDLGFLKVHTLQSKINSTNDCYRFNRLYRARLHYS
jgi:hypothetical protein